MPRLVARFLLCALLPVIGLGASMVWAQPIPTIDPKPSLTELSSLDYVYDVLVDTARGRLNMRYNPKKSGPLTGAILGHRIEGYRVVDTVTKAQSLAFLQFKSNPSGTEIATNVFVAEYNTTERSWIGVSYAIDVALGGASSAHNATPFRTTGPLPALCARDPACVARFNQLTPLPPVQSPIAIDAAALAGFGIDAGGQRGPLVLRAGAGGNSEGILSGHVLGDALTGHYARGGGTIAMLRLLNGKPVQVLVGVLDSGGVKGGRGYPLTGSGGNPFNWTILTNDRLATGLRSLHERDRCLTPDDPASGPGGSLSLTTGCSNARWVLFAIGSQLGTGQTLYSLVSVASGLCLQMPGSVGAAVVLQVCNGTGRQALLIDDVQQVGTQVGLPVFGEVAVNGTVAFGASSNAQHLKAQGAGSKCLAIFGATGAAVESPCFENPPNNIMGPDVPNSKAGWTHDP